MFQCDNDDKELESISREMQKTVLWESESLVKKNLIWTVDMMYSNLTNKFLQLKSPSISFSRKWRFINANIFGDDISVFLNHCKSLKVTTSIDAYCEFTFDFSSEF